MIPSFLLAAHTIVEVLALRFLYILISIEKLRYLLPEVSISFYLGKVVLRVRVRLKIFTHYLHNPLYHFTRVI